MSRDIKRRPVSRWGWTDAFIFGVLYVLHAFIQMPRWLSMPRLTASKQDGSKTAGTLSNHLAPENNTKAQPVPAQFLFHGSGSCLEGYVGGWGDLSPRDLESYKPGIAPARLYLSKTCDLFTLRCYHWNV